MVRGELRRCVLWFLVSGFWGQGTPMAGKKASLTLRLELCTIQPTGNGKYVFSGICDAEGVVYTARSRPLRRSRSHKHHLPREKRFCGAKHWRSVSGASLTTFGVK